MKRKLVKISRENARIRIDFFGIKINFKNPLINQLGDCCCIPDLDRLLDNGCKFPHPVGIVINRCAVIGKNCTIYQGVTIAPKPGPGITPVVTVGDNVRICANATVVGNITIGNNAVIGAGAVVVKDVPENAVVAGNPAAIIKYINVNEKSSR